MCELFFLTIRSSLYTHFPSLRKSKITHRFWAFAQFIRAMCPALADHHFDVVSDPSFHFWCKMRIRIRSFTQMRIRIRLFTWCGSGSLKICDHWHTYTPGLYFELPYLHCERPGTAVAPLEPSKLLIFNFDADPDPAFQSYAGPDPASQNDAAQNP